MFVDLDVDYVVGMSMSMLENPALSMFAEKFYFTTRGTTAVIK